MIGNIGGNENLFRLNEQEKKNFVQNLEKKEQQLQIFLRLVSFRNLEKTSLVCALRSQEKEAGNKLKKLSTRMAF